MYVYVTVTVSSVVTLCAVKFIPFCLYLFPESIFMRFILSMPTDHFVLQCFDTAGWATQSVNRVTTFLEFLEISGNSAKIREKAKSRGKLREFV